ncbi:uncharacterized protein LOC111085996 [Limulus polyphemus]|uniref:Uncharacterized protein LOC111085996 n=1 Tax=Limulus polyphemus TaxID=6850 RepID=A0ABM1SGW2_LIMPO|nr:uncharacterized protein LOC111085996 [Limulus polyphemus]
MNKITSLALCAVMLVLMTSSIATPVGMSSNFQHFDRMAMPYLKNHIGSYTLLNRPLTSKQALTNIEQTGSATEMENDENDTVPDVGITDFEGEELSDMDTIKRQFDDYGHMRFGRNGRMKKHDEYGHMYFGK